MSPALYPLSYTPQCTRSAVHIMVEPRGFEPRFLPCHGKVLPLDDGPEINTKRVASKTTADEDSNLGASPHAMLGSRTPRSGHGPPPPQAAETEKRLNPDRPLWASPPLREAGS